MTILHILKTEPDKTTKDLLSAFDASDSGDSTAFRLYDEKPDFEKLVDLIFEHEKNITWW